MKHVIAMSFIFVLLAGCAATTEPTAADAPAADVSELMYFDESQIDFSIINENGQVERNGSQLTLSWKDMPTEGTVKVRWTEPGSSNSGSVDATVANGKVVFEDPNPLRRTIFSVPAGKATINLAERKVPAPGMDNLRDLGGLRTAEGRHVKWGFLYRADRLQKAANKDGYSYLLSMNLGNIFDLRALSEIISRPDPSIDGVVYSHTRIPDDPPVYKGLSWDTNESIFEFVSTPAALEFYIVTNAYMVDQEESHETMKAIFAAALKGDGKAMIWHCSGGKDRTG
jgi:protein-tyrosine phosphatase